MLGFAFGVINYEGNNYNEKLLPQTFGGASTIRYVVIGTDISLTANNTANNNTTTFLINGISYLGLGNVSVTKSDDDRYYIYFVPKGNKSASITISGTNDWVTNQKHNDITLPYNNTSPDTGFYRTRMELGSITRSGLDMLLINNVDFTLSTPAMPERIDGYYYIYYGPSNPGTPSVTLNNGSSTAISLPFRKTGADKNYYSVKSDLNSISSVNMDHLFINNSDYTNLEANSFPDTIEGNYYIYYESSDPNAEVFLLPSPTAIDLPFAKTGTGSFYYSTNVSIASVSSSNMDFLMINNVDFTNQTTSDLPERINGNYYIYYEASNSNAELNLFWLPFLNVKVFLDGGF